jgi:5'-methylthioadenosine phosphorylase
VTPHAEIGVFGGSGFYELMEDGESVTVDTPFGLPSAPPMIGTVAGRQVAFLPRHGLRHELPPHRINYQANIWAMKSLGVDWIVAPCAVGSLQPNVRIGDFVVCDQFVDRTSGRADTFYDGPETTHVSSADPYSPVLRRLLVEGCHATGVPVHDGGTIVVIQGPRFSTRAESRWFAKEGWEVINMTAYPEAHLAREVEIAYANVALVTDYDAGMEGEPEVGSVTTGDVMAVLAQNNHRMVKLLDEVIPKIPTGRDPHVASVLAQSRL